jgi:hypothetical protein
MSNVITEIKKLLGMEIKLEQMALDNGTIVEAEIFEAGQSIFIVNGEDRVALPVGEYMLEDGMILMVAEEGIIAEIKEAVVEEEAPAVEEEVEATQSTPSATQATVAKKVIESVVKESHFSQEDVDALKAEIESLKTELAKQVEVVEEKVELSIEPLTHNPEAKSEVKLNLYSQKRAKSTFDSVLNKISNIK